MPDRKLAAVLFCLSIMTATRIAWHVFITALFDVSIGLVELVLCLVFIDVCLGDSSFR